jgi:hypothetical protein
VRVSLNLRAPDEGRWEWLVSVDAEGNAALLGLFEADEWRAIMPVLRERVEHEKVEGDDDGQAHLRRNLLEKLDRLVAEGNL